MRWCIATVLVTLVILSSAIRSYTKAGFTLAGNFKIVYFR